jgi:hypothetical protein
VGSGPVTVLIALGAGAIAFWIYVRFPRLTPDDMRGVLIHLGAWLVASYVIAGPAMTFLFTYEQNLHTLVAIFGFAFPVIVYGLLCGFWVMKVLHGTMRGLIR